MRNFVRNWQLLIASCLISNLIYADNLAECKRVGQQLLKVITSQSEAINAKDRCQVGKDELAISSLKTKHKACFKQHKQFNLDSKDYVFKTEGNCKFVKDRYGSLQRSIEKERKNKNKCELGQLILDLKSLIGDNFNCLDKKDPQIIKNKK